MRKILFIIFSALLLLLAACDESDSTEGNGDTDQEETDVEEEESEKETDPENSGPTEEEVQNEEVKPDADANKDEEKQPEQGNDDVVDVATDVIWAQIDEDYAFLKSVAGEGVTVNEKNNTIEFNNEEGSHTFDFLTGINEEDLEFRFVEGEETDRAIVGFAAIDYENEYSYVTEMIFKHEAGEWKLASMDINK